MAFLHHSRLLFIVPQARCANFNTYIKNNIDPDGGDWLTPKLSATGSLPATHAWCSAALTNQQLESLVTRLLNLANIDKPANWDSLTLAQKRTWLRTQRQEIRTRLGIWIVPIDNTGVWDNPDEALQTMGLLRTDVIPSVVVMPSLRSSLVSIDDQGEDEGNKGNKKVK